MFLEDVGDVGPSFLSPGIVQRGLFFQAGQLVVLKFGKNSTCQGEDGDCEMNKSRERQHFGLVLCEKELRNLMSHASNVVVVPSPATEMSPSWLY